MKKKELNKTWIVLSIALTVALLAGLGARAYLAQQVAAIEARSKLQGKMIARVVATQDLPRGTPLSNATAAIRQIPAEYAHSGGIDPAEFDRVDGLLLSHSVKDGEMILWSMIEGKRAPTFSARINTGRRAMTFPVDEINSISGMLEPGDRIDLILTLDQAGQKTTFPFMQNMAVLATGRRSIDDVGSGELRSYATVTLDSTPEEAQAIIVARNTGKITALLRNPQDMQPVPGLRNVASLFNSGNLAASPPIVPVLYGKSRLSAHGLHLRGARPNAPGAANEAAAEPLAPVYEVGLPTPLPQNGETAPPASTGIPAIQYEAGLPMPSPQTGEAEWPASTGIPAIQYEAGLPIPAPQMGSSAPAPGHARIAANHIAPAPLLDSGAPYPHAPVRHGPYSAYAPAHP